jgi:hypothetical protein
MFAGKGVPIDRLSTRLADAQPPGGTPGQRFLRSGDLGFCRDGE